MRFGSIGIDAAEGAILAHAVSAGGRRWHKGQRLSGEDVAVLQSSGIRGVVAASLDPDDLGEDAAAAFVGAALRFDGAEAHLPATGRVNFHASAAGVFTVHKMLIDRLNAIDPSVTVATLPDFARVSAGQMVATVKIIPFAVSSAVAGAVGALGDTELAFAVHPFRSRRVGLVQTILEGTKSSVLDKTRRVTQARLSRSESCISRELRVAHEVEATAAAITACLGDCDLVLVFGGSAVCDANDVVPAAIRAAGGSVFRVGMPVDPGNLLVLAAVGDTPVISAPGCARSPKENGFDWVLDRLAADLPVTAGDIAGMGVGGLLTEIPTRPQPREAAPAGSGEPLHAVVLAAGRSSRMGGPNKLMARFGGEPLVRTVAARVIASKVAATCIVTGYQKERIAEALEGLAVRLVDNPDFAAGLAASLKAGVAALPERASGALVVLGDMPGVGTADLDRMIDAFEAAGGKMIVRATANGRRGNPVILPRSLFPEVEKLEGDTGARHLVEGGPVIDVELGEGAETDVDTPEAMRLAGGVLQG